MYINIEDFIRNNLMNYRRLTPMIISIIEGILRSNDIDFLSVTGRTKTKESIIGKQRRKEYKDFAKKFTDISGVRIITFLNSDVNSIEEIIKRTFEIDKENSLDRAGSLGTDRIGYRSVHYVCTLGEARAGIAEYSSLCDLKFEIQIRTVLQHAWAELAHDRSYKFGATLPPNLERQINLYSGLLELADKGFEEISNSIDSYAKEIAKSSPVELNDKVIDSITFVKFMTNFLTVNKIETKRKIDDESVSTCISELHEYGLNSVADLNSIISDDAIESLKQEIAPKSVIGIIRLLMLFHDIDRYFSRVNFSWGRIHKGTYDTLTRKYEDKKIQSILKDKNVEIVKPE
ncbi:GTP pyrophosphokinase [Nitrospirillum amazonense]|uniref:PpGpp synthetase/RelA/SpoT-type nucleotidyltransferase n=1 Tax=Nitrospirillum amazonense TaxID=28077 RepID=A0A560K2F1_9PROT|nr:GTP pyrophosphokinase [Nitrospirillum amazonense]MDG3443931.1 hypothetical protein [Nitrospirillum amazonense]TWB77491.1 ppGpp synthetase/RelA/SpoT-type nucleotidyltransferase [Nitrospirillum amazonense]